mmetsp:Transcript_602/g.1230  ORF Transcript_602/g.1230 Transcript_602/m.1230 type:complete len:272 (+) Transcript_602:564-1379(+)
MEGRRRRHTTPQVDRHEAEIGAGGVEQRRGDNVVRRDKGHAIRRGDAGLLLLDPGVVHTEDVHFRRYPDGGTYRAADVIDQAERRKRGEEAGVGCAAHGLLDLAGRIQAALRVERHHDRLGAQHIVDCVESAPISNPVRQVHDDGEASIGIVGVGHDEHFEDGQQQPLARDAQVWRNHRERRIIRRVALQGNSATLELLKEVVYSFTLRRFRVFGASDDVGTLKPPTKPWVDRHDLFHTLPDEGARRFVIALHERDGGEAWLTWKCFLDRK